MAHALKNLQLQVNLHCEHFQITRKKISTQQPNGCKKYYFIDKLWHGIMSRSSQISEILKKLLIGLTHYWADIQAGIKIDYKAKSTASSIVAL
jgi:hypothetical protein